jgi:AAA domain
MTHTEVATAIKELKDKNVVLLYAFNSTGKTRLCVEYKNLTKDPGTGDHAGIYYNAYSEDLFQWDNDEENDNADMRLMVVRSSLNGFHSNLMDNHELVRAKLAPYQPKYTFDFNAHKNRENGIESVTFFASDEDRTPIKISRGEERMFVFCFFLALFDVEDWSKKQNAHIYIDDPVSSLDDHNVFITAQLLFDLILSNFKDKKVIVSTHHVGLYWILMDLIRRGEKASTFKNKNQPYILSNRNGDLQIKAHDADVFMFHLHLLQTLQEARKNKLYKYHIVLLRQVLENVGSFLGVGLVKLVLKEIKVEKEDEVVNMINSLSHKKEYQMQFNVMSPDEEAMFTNVLDRLMDTYHFNLP